jgi:uncharacterized repeat protein (TIGR01451 family)
MSRGLWFAMSARTRRSLTLLWTALFVCSLALQYVQLATPTTVLAADGLKAQTVQGFEVDGNLRSGDASTNPGEVPANLIVSQPMSNGDDWLQGPGGNNVVSLPSTNTATSFLFTDLTDPGDTSAYGGGNKEDDTRDWVYVNNAGPNPKTDFKHVMAHARTVGNSAYAFMGVERIVNNGTMVVDFELNKKPFKQFSVGPLKPNRSNGDLLISLEYSNGGSNPIVTIYTMTDVTDYPQGQTVTFSKVSDAATLDAVRSATNFVELTTSGFGYAVPAFDFAEASIDLSALGISLACPGFSSGHMRSRTGGDPQSSQLKDAAPAFPIDLNNCGKLRIEKEDEDGEKLGGATFTISPDPRPGAGGDFTVTDGGAGDPDGSANGVILIDPATPGSYTVTETVAPDGYIRDGDPQSKTIESNGSATFTFVNELGSLRWEKYGPDGTSLLGGATFEITPNPLTGTGSLTVVDDGARDDDGTPGEFRVDDARVGTYSVCETVAPEGYILDTGCAAVSVSAADPDGSIATGTFINTLGSIDWVKNGPDGTSLLGGATFEITPNPLTGTGSLTVVDDGANDDDGTSGEFRIDDARVGTYTVCETAAPAGYIMDTECAEVTVSAADPSGSIASGAFINTLGSIAWKKVDGAGQLLAGATFTVSPDPSDGVGVMTVADNGPKDADPVAGQFKVDDIRTGSYTVTETVAPEGYALDAGPCTIVVSQAAPDGDTVCSFVDTPIPPAIRVVKTAGQTAGTQVAEGATYTTEAFVDNTVYRYVVTNTGPVKLLNVTLTDDNGTPANTADDFLVCPAVASLVPGASFTCTATMSITADTTNIATAAGVSVGAGLPASDTDDAVVDVVGPAISVIKTAGGAADAQVADGATYLTEIFVDNVTYAYLVANTGEIALGGITLVDDSGTASGADDFMVTCPASSLAPGESMTCTATRTLVDDRTNLVTATGFTSQQPDRPVSDTDDADVVIQRPSIDLVKTAGDAADGAVLPAEAGPVTYRYLVTNTGPLTLFDIVVTDDAGTPGDASDDVAAVCPKSALSAGESMTCEATVDVLVDTVNVAVVRGATIKGNPASAQDDASVRILVRDLTLDKTNDAPIETLELPDGSTADLPTAVEGSTVTYTLAYTFEGDPATDAIITDVLPLGVTYVDGTATDDVQFTFGGYDAASRTLTWTAPVVEESGSVTYQATIDVGASGRSQPLVNVASIVSAQTGADDAESDVYVPAIPAAATGTPKVTLPPTDTLADPHGTGTAGSGLMLVLVALAVVVLVVGFVTPVPSSVRERSRRR